MTVATVPTLMNGRWTLNLPEHRTALWEHDWERERIDSMHSVLGPGWTIVDVGAEEGDCPALWASWGCKVAMIEPVPATWANIRAVWEANDLPHPVGMFVGFASDVDDLAPAGGKYGHVIDGYWPVCSTGAVITSGMFAHLSEQSDSIPQVTLDTFAARRSLHVDALTIDSEGSELRVLHGARRILTEDRPHVWVSCHSDRDWMDAQYDGTTADDVDAYMASMGYDCTDLGTDHERHARFSPRG